MLVWLLFVIWSYYVQSQLVFDKLRTEVQTLGLVTVTSTAQKEIPPHWTEISQLDWIEGCSAVGCIEDLPSCAILAAELEASSLWKFDAPEEAWAKYIILTLLIYVNQELCMPG